MRHSESSNYFDGVEWMSGEDEANPPEASSEEVLQGTDRFLLFRHFYFLQEGKKHQIASTELNPTGSKVKSRMPTNRTTKSNMLPARSWLRETVVCRRPRCLLYLSPTYLQGPVRLPQSSSVVRLCLESGWKLSTSVSNFIK